MTYQEAHEYMENLQREMTKHRFAYSNELIIANGMAILALEKQIQKKPENHSGHYTDNLCPLCGKRIKSGQGSSSRERTNWCNHCGQAIDWGDE